MREQKQAAMRESDAYERIRTRSTREREQRERHRNDQSVVLSLALAQQKNRQCRERMSMDFAGVDVNEKTCLLIRHDVDELDLGVLELKLGMGWSDDQALANVKNQQLATATTQIHCDDERQKGLAPAPTRRTSRGFLLAMVLLLLCVLPVLRAHMPLRWIGAASTMV